MPQAAQLIPIKVVDKVVDELRRRLGGRSNAVKEQLLEDLAPVPVGHQRRGAGRSGGRAQDGPLRYALASPISGGVAGRPAHHAISCAYSSQAAIRSPRPAAVLATPTRTCGVRPMRRAAT